jgi:HEAT repeat protein
MTFLTRLRSLRHHAAAFRERVVHTHGDDARRVATLLDIARGGSLDASGRRGVRLDLSHVAPAVRRSAARALEAHPHPDDLAALSLAVAEERAPDVALALARAARACGADPVTLEAHLDRIEGLRVATIDGWRRPWATAPLELRDRFRGEPEPPAETAEARPEAGRRAQHQKLAALGRAGHPDGLRPLRAALEAMDDDPGHAFAQRRVAARALGQIGLPEAAPWLRDALLAERRDHEGRPGAGMGVQFPVRASLLLAIGMLQDVDAAPILVSHLDALEASPLGGLHLPAMAALVMIGPAATPTLQVAARSASATRAAHAFAVLHALGQVVPKNDPRPTVADVLAQISEVR